MFKKFITVYSLKTKGKLKEDAANDTAAEKMEEVAPMPLIIQVNNILFFIFSKVGVYINNQQIYKSNELCSHKSYISIEVKGV